MAGTTISIYDSPDSVNVNDPETTLTVYEMFIGVGPAGPTGATGPAGASAVAGKLPNSYVELAAPEGVTSATLVDIPGMSTTITLEETVEIAVLCSFELQTQSGASASTIGIAVNINGTDYDSYERYLSGTNDTGIGAITHRSAELAAGTYTVKMRFQRTAGVSTPGVNHMDMIVMALQGSKGADSTITIVPTADNDFVIGNSGGTWEKKTLAQTKTALSITNAPNVATDATSDMLFGVASAWAKKTLAEGKTILGIDTSTAAGDFLVGNGSGVFTKRTLAQTQVVLNPYALIGGVLHKQLWIAGWKPTKTAGCGDSAQIEMGTNKNVYDYLPFDKDTIEYAYANVPLPQDYTGGTIYGQPYWAHPATTTNFKTSLGLSGVAIADDGTLDVAQGTPQYSNDTGGTTSDLYIGPQTSAITIAGTPEAGKLVQFWASRKADDGTNDTMAVDAYLLGWLIWYPVR